MQNEESEVRIDRSRLHQVVPATQEHPMHFSFAANSAALGLMSHVSEAVDRSDSGGKVICDRVTVVADEADV